ncbi:MAG: helix-turn-helix transcriptional regulator [Clostridiaceae bacterium]|nr:helix-turn-helix transcriptional regulator [Clostridiaceae bacterium]
MYEIFAKLLEEHNVTSYRVSMETGVSQATLSDWKRGRSVPKLPKMQKLADYFGVSVECLMGISADSDAPSAPPSDSDIKFALFGDREIDDDVLDEVKAFAKFAQERRKTKK